MKYYATRDKAHEKVVDGPFAWVRIWRIRESYDLTLLGGRWCSHFMKVIEEYKLPYAPEFLRDMRHGEIREVNVRIEVTPK